MSAASETPRAALLACLPFGRELPAQRVGERIAAGLIAAGRAAPDVMTGPARDPGASGTQELLEREHFDVRMRAARALVICVRRLQESTLAASLPFELATRARQAGVPCYAVAAQNKLSSFDERVLDLQVVIEAADAAALRRAGSRLAAIL